MKKSYAFALFFIFIISRLIFINTNPVFFDSNEYLDIFSSSSYIRAIISGHYPPHEGYMLLFWPIFHLANYFHINPVYSIILGQIILACLTIYCFYKVVIFISGKKTAINATIIASLIPLFWITNVTIMMEIAYVTFFLLSLSFLTRYLAKDSKNYNLHISLLFFSLAVLTDTMVILWAPLYLSLVFFKNKNKLKIVFLYLIIYIVIFSIGNILLISSVSHVNPRIIVHFLYFSKGGEFADLPFNLKGLLIAMRNFLIPLMRNNTSLLVLLSFLALIVFFAKEKKFFVLGVLWILPAVYTNQWWDALFSGRHATIAGFGIALIVVYFLRNRPIFTSLLSIYLIFVSFPALNLLNKDIPYVTEANFVKSLPKNSLLIDTHFAKPQVQKTFKGTLLAVNDTLTGRDEIGKQITFSLAKKKPVFISSGALSDPYGLYSGPYLHILTLSYDNHSELSSIIKNFTFVTYKKLNVDDNLIIYKIVSNKPSPYPPVKDMRYSYRRIDYYDPLWRLYALIK